MNSVYYEDERYTDTGVLIDNDVTATMKTIFSKWVAKGVPIRQISHVALNVVTMLECEEILNSYDTRCLSIPRSGNRKTT